MRVLTWIHPEAMKLYNQVVVFFAILCIQMDMLMSQGTRERVLSQQFNRENMQYITGNQFKERLLLKMFLKKKVLDMIQTEYVNSLREKPKAIEVRTHNKSKKREQHKLRIF